MLEPLDAQRVYASVRGTLVDCVAAGERVSSGQHLAQLDDSDLRKKVAKLNGDLERLKVRIQNLESRVVVDDNALAQLPVAKEMLADIEQQLAHRMREEQALTLRAPLAGTVFPPPAIPHVGGDLRLLPRWTGTPLEDRNVGCTLDKGTLLCLVGTPHRYEAVLFVDEADIGLVRAGQRVRMSFTVTPGVVLSGTVLEIAGRETQAVPRELAAGREMANRPDTTGVLRPLKTSYEVRVKLDDNARSLVIGAVAQDFGRTANGKPASLPIDPPDTDRPFPYAENAEWQSDLPLFAMRGISRWALAHALRPTLTRAADLLGSKTAGRRYAATWRRTQHFQGKQEHASEETERRDCRLKTAMGDSATLQTRVFQINWGVAKPRTAPAPRESHVCGWMKFQCRVHNGLVERICCNPSAGPFPPRADHQDLVVKCQPSSQKSVGPRTVPGNSSGNTVSTIRSA